MRQVRLNSWSLTCRSLARLLALWLCLWCLSGCGPQAPTPGLLREDLKQALQPLVDVMVAQGEVQQEDRGRLQVVTGELIRLSGVVAGWSEAKGAVRDHVEELSKRILKLDQEFDAARSRHAADQSLLLNALDKTVDRLDGLLRQIGSEPAQAPAGGTSEKDAGSDLLADLLRYGLILVLLGCLLLLVRFVRRGQGVRRTVMEAVKPMDGSTAAHGRTGSQTTSVTDVRPELRLEAAVGEVQADGMPVRSGPAVQTAAPATAVDVEPHRTTVELMLRNPSWLRERLRPILLARCDVLIAPAPTFEVDQVRLRITFATKPDEGIAERVEAELIALALEYAQQARQSDSPAA